MSMADDWKRLCDLDHAKGGFQFGQYLDIVPMPGAPDTVQVAKDMIRVEGEKCDINAWRIYLGRWEPRPDIPIEPLIAGAIYADPTPWSFPQPTNLDSFTNILPLYARIMWGSGGIQHSAWVDWPRRGCLVQVSASYVQVNAFVNTQTPNIDPRVLPTVRATIAPEPGGGESIIPATFTYPRNDTQIDPILPPYAFQNFQIPPFARSFIPIVNWLSVIGATQLRAATMAFPLGITTFAMNTRQVWITNAPATVDDMCCWRDGFPIDGQDSGVVRLEATTPGTELGCMFLLDL